MPYELPEIDESPAAFKEAGITIHRAMTPDKFAVVDFVRDHFGDQWAGECDVVFSREPVSCFIAVKGGDEIVGFACYEATCKSYFGPTGVLKEYRGRGVGNFCCTPCKAFARWDTPMRLSAERRKQRNFIKRRWAQL